MLKRNQSEYFFLSLEILPFLKMDTKALGNVTTEVLL